MAQRFNPLSGTFDLVLDKAAEISYDDSGNAEVSGATVQAAIDDIDAIIAALPDPIYYAGTWNASTNTPTLANTDVGVTGALYQVNVAGTVDFGAGSISFEVGDRVVNNGTEWQKWDMTDAVNSVNGATGVVVLDTDDVGEGVTNLYFTDARAQAAITGAASSITTLNLTSNRALISNASGKVAVSAVTDTELGYLSGVTSGLQTQLGGKASTELDNLGTTAINATLEPDADVSYDVGSNTNGWSLGYFSTVRAKDTSPGALLSSGLLEDSSNQNSVDWENRQLVAPDGFTTMLDWSGTDVSLNTRKLTNVVDPTVAQDAATKNYVDTQDTATQAAAEAASNAYTDLQTRTNYLRSYFDGTSIAGITSSVGGLTTALNTATPLRGASSQRFSKDASNRQNEAWLIPLQDIDAADLEGTKPQTLSFTYKTSAAYASSDIRVYIWDNTNSSYITVQSAADPSGFLLASPQATKFTGVWYPVESSDDYELRFFVSTANASAYDLDVVDLKCGPDSVVPGAIIREFDSLAFTSTWTTNTTLTARGTRVGNRLMAHIKLSLSGAPDATTLIITAPANAPFDIAALNSPSGSGAKLGYGIALDAGVLSYEVSPRYDGAANAVTIVNMGASGTNVANDSVVSNTAPFAFGAGDEINIYLDYPVLGWEASATISADESILVPVKVIARNGAGTSFADATETDVPFPTIVTDTHNAFDGTLFTAPKTAKYRFNTLLSLGLTTASSTGRYIILADASNSQVGLIMQGAKAPVSQIDGLNGSNIVSLQKGQQVKVRLNQSDGGPRSLQALALNNYLEIDELPDFSVFSQYNVVDRQYDLTVTGTGWTTASARGVPYVTADGRWRLRFNIAGQITSTSSVVLSIAGVQFYDNGASGIGLDRQAVSAYDNSGGSQPSNCFVTSSGDNIVLNFGAATTAITCSGDVELDSKPTFVP